MLRDTLSAKALRALIVAAASWTVLLAHASSCGPVDHSCPSDTLKCCLNGTDDCTCAPKCGTSSSDCYGWEMCIDGECEECKVSQRCRCINEMCLPSDWHEGQNVEFKKVSQ